MRNPLLSLLALSLLAGNAPLFATPARKPASPPATPGPRPAAVNFDREVRPILSENCYACHGFDSNKRQANLRLDDAAGAFKPAASGKTPILPGNVAGSELFHRISAANGLKMPPESSGKKLSAAQIGTLKRWIAQGGKYAPHWAFIAPVRPPLPEVKNHAWAANPIDRFVLAKLEAAGLKPSPTADRYTLVRRVSLDLNGLPPTPAEVDQFISDRAPGAYERLVDRLLASPHFGERLALKWLDLARYADTHGYHIDSAREMWPWRDWVIRSFNQNLPYDQFVIDQLAGDLLPNATLEQKIATGFNRNHPINFEGGAIPEEYAANYIFDRIDTTSTTFMALTLRCTQCHDHKFDPFTQKEFYQLYAFFNNVPENGLDGQSGNAKPFIKAPSAEQQAQLADFDRKVAESEAAVKARASAAASGMATWEQGMLASTDAQPAVTAGLIARWGLDEASGEEVKDSAGRQPVAHVRGKASWSGGKFGGALSFDGSNFVEVGDGPAFERTDRFSYGAWIYPASTEAGTVLSRMNDGGQFRGWDLYVADGRAFVHLVHEWDKNAIRVDTKSQMPLNAWHHLFVTYDGSGKAAGVKIYVDGKAADLDRTHDSLTDTIKSSTPVFIGRRNPGAPFRGMIDEVRVYDRELSAAEVQQLAGWETIRQILATQPEKRTSEQAATLTRYYLENYDERYRKLNGELAGWKKSRTELDAKIPTCMVMEEMPTPRETHLLLRGQYDKKGDKVEPGVPSILPPLPSGVKADRLALAKWLVDPSHPLTARVAVNRYWEMLFGAGLVRTPENFGTQGDRPTHPELLDWLAVAFASVHSGEVQSPKSKVQSAGAVQSPKLATRTGGPKVQSDSPMDAAAETSLSWDTKALLKLIVTSNAYKQVSVVSNPQSAIRNPQFEDPENRLLARGPRHRLTAEFVRDQALAVSGLLVDQVGGPSVRPYQPPGLWEELAFGGGFSAQSYVQDHGEALYRRSMYTFWKRTCPPPSLLTFDAPEREFCMVRRSVSNTPLQALVLMNDPTYVEAARKLAERLMKEGGSTPKDRLAYACRLVLCRPARPHEIDVLLPIYAERLASYQKDPAAAEKLLAVGESKRDEKLEKSELAAWTAIANVLLNLDETISKN